MCIRLVIIKVAPHTRISFLSEFLSLPATHTVRSMVGYCVPGSVASLKSPHHDNCVYVIRLRNNRNDAFIENSVGHFPRFPRFFPPEFNGVLNNFFTDVCGQRVNSPFVNLSKKFFQTPSLMHVIINTAPKG